MGDDAFCVLPSLYVLNIYDGQNDYYWSALPDTAPQESHVLKGMFSIVTE